MRKVNNSGCSIKEGAWVDYREDVKLVNRELYDIIEKIDPNEKYKLFEITYPYGEKITDLGTLCLPDKDGVVRRLDHLSIPSKYREQLSYAVTPLILQLTNGSEVFIDTGERIIPLNIFTPGDLYGLFEAISPITGSSITPCWSVTGGARSVFLGAKVTDALGHKRLKKEYKINAEPPRKLSQQWDILKIIADRSRPNNPWICKVLVFGKEWLEEKDDDLGWVLFHRYLLIQSWLQSQYIRGKSEYSIMWEAFATVIRDKNLKPGPYILDTILHNLALASGAVPGFKFADDSELLLPSKSIEYAYENVYMLKEYASIILHPWRLGAMGNYNSIYYSMSYPTVLEGTPAIRHAPSIISEIADTKAFMQLLENIVAKHSERLYRVLKDVKFEYFHNEDDKFQQITHSSEIHKTDQNLLTCLKRFKIKNFPCKGPFFRGCIRISKYFTKK